MTLKSNFTMAEPPPETINFIGDSLVRSFGGKLFLDYNDGDRRVITQSRWRPYFRSSLFFSGNCFDDAMTRAFWDLKCIVRSRSNPSDIFTPLKLRIFDEVTEEMQFRANLEMPATIISCGGVEIWDMEEELYPHYSFEVEDAPELFELLPKYDSPNKLSYAEVSERLENRVQPLYAGMMALKRAGFSDLYMLGLPPPSLETREAWKPVSMRYAMRLMINRIHSRFCEREGIGFIPTWDLVSGPDGLRDQSFFEDAEHYSAAALPKIVSRACDFMREPRPAARSVTSRDSNAYSA